MLRWTYAQLYRGAQHLAFRLKEFGVIEGSSVAFFTENRAEWALFCWASILLGCPFVPLNPRLVHNREELGYILGQICPSVIVALGYDVRSKLQENAHREIEKGCLLVTLEEAAPPESMLQWMSLHDIWSNAPLNVNTYGKGKIFNDTTIIGFTSGTTSLPKACPQSSNNLMTSALAVKERRKINANDRLCQHLPSFAAMAVLISLTCFISGATIVYPSPSFNATATLDAIEKERCTYTFAAPAIVKALAMHPDIASRSLTSLRIVELGGAPIYPEILQLATAKDGLNCERVGCGWGMTESPCPILAEPWERSMPLPADYIAVGRPIRGSYLKICAPESILPLQSSEVGELHVGGPQLVRGYLSGQDDAFYFQDGMRWIRTGDMAQIQDGSVYIVGGYKHIIIRGGHNISPSKVERCLERVPSVEAQVVGIPDEQAGEIPIAVLKLSPSMSSHDATIKAVQEMAIAELGPTETPQAFIELGELELDNFPATLSGKIQKGVLSSIVQNYLSSLTLGYGPLDIISTETTLLELWAQVAGVSASSINVNTSVFTFVDSITTMRFSTLVDKKLQKRLTVDDVISHSDIRSQAKLLDSRPIHSAVRHLNLRTGPPTAVEMVHCRNDPSRAELTKALTISFLGKLGLSWDDVEDIFPAPDTSFIYLNRQRPQTWNQRVIYLTHNPVEKLMQAWKAILIHHAMFRTLAIPTSNSPNTHDFPKHLFLVLHPSSPFWNCSITSDLSVPNPECIRQTFLDQWADPTRHPLVRTAFISIQEPPSSAMILIGNHAAYDNISMDLLISDLSTALTHSLTSDNILQAPGHTPFRHFADLYFRHRTGPTALEAATWHATRLRGIGSLESSLWPRARAPGWFKGPAEGWTMRDGSLGAETLRTPIDPPGSLHGLDGLTRTARVATLAALRRQYGIAPHVVLKAAVALFSMQQTGTSTALFANVEAGRKWPFGLAGTEGEGEELPDALGIAGPMFQVVLNRVSVLGGGEDAGHVRSGGERETAISFLRRLQDEQALLTQYAQAPIFLIETHLEPQDRVVFWDALARQGYNWAPGIQQASTEQQSGEAALVKFNRQALDDIGLAWTCGLGDSETFYVNASYDDCQLGKDEVYGYLGDVLRAGVWLADPKNADKPVSKVCFGEGDISGLIASLE